MVVVPTSTHVSLHYGYTPVDNAGRLLTVAGLGAVGALAMAERRSGSDQFTLARMYARPDLQAEGADGLTDRSRASNRPSCPWLPVESGEHSVAGGVYLSSAGCAKLSADGCVVVIQYPGPATIAHNRGFLGRADDIDEQDSGKHAIGLDLMAYRTSADSYFFEQPFILMAESPRNCFSHIVSRPLLRTIANSFLPRSTGPVNPSAMARSTYLDGAPLQKHSRADPTNRPGFGRIAGHIRMMNADAEEFGHSPLSGRGDGPVAT